jgi:hypothetical protein
VEGLFEGPPEDSFGVLVPLHLVVVGTADLAVAIPGVTAYRNGFGFDLAIRRAAAEDDAFTLDRTLHWLGREGSPPPEVLRVGVQFADGQTATSLDTWWDYARGELPKPCRASDCYLGLLLRAGDSNHGPEHAGGQPGVVAASRREAHHPARPHHSPEGSMSARLQPPGVTDHPTGS